MAEKKEKRYVSDNAQLMAEWDWEKNNKIGIYPSTITLGSDKKVWWLCNAGHSYNDAVNRYSDAFFGRMELAESPKVVPESRIVIASEPFLQHILEEQKTSILIPNKNAHIVLT